MILHNLFHHLRGSISDRTTIFYSSQVNALLSSLDIETDVQARRGPPGRFQELEDVWNDSQNLHNGPRSADGWIAEYDQHRVQRGNPNDWAHSFEQLHGANNWASEFENVRTTFGMLYWSLAVIFLTNIILVICFQLTEKVSFALPLPYFI